MLNMNHKLVKRSLLASSRQLFSQNDGGKKEERPPRQNKQEQKSKQKPTLFEEIKKTSLDIRDQISKFKWEQQWKKHSQQLKVYYKWKYRNVVVGLGLGFVLSLIYSKATQKKVISREQLAQLIDSNLIGSIQIFTIEGYIQHLSRLTVVINSSNNQYVTYAQSLSQFLSFLENKQYSIGREEKDFIPVKIGTFDNFWAVLQRNKSTLFKLAFTYFILRSRNIQKAFKGKSVVKQNNVQTKVNVKFKDVAGLDQAKVQIQQIVAFLKNSKHYKQIGARTPKGALLNGPPGTGKTLLAKACAGQAQVPFFYMSGSDFVEGIAGLGANRVRELFNQAKLKAPSIIFIDQIDAVGRKRSNRSRSNDQRDNTLNQLLVQMDGFQSKADVIVLAATNRKELLDEALLRPGRFDRSIDITLPSIHGRSQILKVHLKKIQLDSKLSLQEYARRLSSLTPGYSGADLANLCNEAAINAARASKFKVELVDFQQANDRIMAGVQRKQIVSQEDKRVTSIHQSGHAVVSWFLEGASPLLKVTIVPRSKGSLGFAQYLPSDSNLLTKQELLDRICFILGGRCAEQHFFGKVTTGAFDDLKKANQIAHSMVVELGMSRVIGFQGFEQGFLKSYSQRTAALIDEQVREIIQACTEKTRAMVSQKAKLISSLADRLIEKQTLNLIDLRNILGERPYPAKDNFKQYLDEVIRHADS